ncbi:MAG TPA: hypothetical protein VD948_06265 [Rhodothermales bacterium]|nr:hypothetical protein [Rhodothermales bacterium]
MTHQRVHGVLAGQPVTFEVEGGFYRRPAPADGLVVETDSTTIFVPLEDVAKAMAAIEAAKAKGRKRP